MFCTNMNSKIQHDSSSIPNYQMFYNQNAEISISSSICDISSISQIDKWNMTIQYQLDVLYFKIILEIGNERSLS